MLALERGAASMGAAVAIGRLDMTASALRAAASREKDGAAARRILALALVLDGADRKTAAETCGMDRQTLRDWVHRYNAEGLTGLHDLTPPGPKPKLTAEQQAVLAGPVGTGPAPGPQAETHGRTAGGAGRAGRDGPRPGSSRGGALAARGFARRAATALRRRVARTLGRQGSGEARLLPALCAPAPSADG